MKMVVFKILTLFVVTTTVFGRTTATEQSQRVNLDTDAINATCTGNFYKDGCYTDFGAFGARQVVISYKNLTTNEGYITLYVSGEYSSQRQIARIDVSSAIAIDETTYEVTEMVNIDPEMNRVFATVPMYENYKNFDEYQKKGIYTLKIKSISFIPKKLNAEIPYRIISTSKNLVLIEKAWYYSLENKVVLMRYNDTCQYKEKFHFERNANGEYRIYKGLTKGSSDGKYLEVRDKSVKIGNEVVLVDYPGNEDNVWSLLLPRYSNSAVKIQSKLTGTCISALHGLGSNLVMVDCVNGKENNWKLQFCDD